MAHEEELGAVDDLPLDGLALVKVHGPCDGDGDGDEGALVVAAAADGLDSDLVAGHFFLVILLTRPELCGIIGQCPIGFRPQEVL